jgi:hypothetical protein
MHACNSLECEAATQHAVAAAAASLLLYIYTEENCCEIVIDLLKACDCSAQWCNGCFKVLLCRYIFEKIPSKSIVKTVISA